MSNGKAPDIKQGDFLYNMITTRWLKPMKRLFIIVGVAIALLSIAVIILAISLF